MAELNSPAVAPAKAPEAIPEPNEPQLAVAVETAKLYSIIVMPSLASDFYLKKLYCRMQTKYFRESLFDTFYQGQN